MRPLRAVVLTTFAIALAVHAPVVAAQTQMLRLDSGFAPDPQNLGGVVGGPIAAQQLDASCRGFVAAQPNYTIVTRTGFNFLRLFVVSEVDTTLVVRFNGRFYCADDTYGLNPGLDLPRLPPGRYEIFVGAYAQAAAGAYRLALTEYEAVTPDTQVVQQPTQPQQYPPTYYGQQPGGPYATNPNAPQYGQQPGGPFIQQPGQPQPYVQQPGQPQPYVQQPGQPQQPFVQQPMQPQPAGPSPLQFDGTPVAGRINIAGRVTTARFETSHTGGAISAAGTPGQGRCLGYTTAAPTYVMNLHAAQAFLRLFVTSAVNTSLVVRYPDGTFHCNDDSFNTVFPSIDGAFAAGAYQIWVGVDQANVVRPFRLSITPDSNQRPGS